MNDYLKLKLGGILTTADLSRPSCFFHREMAQVIDS